MKVYIFGAGGGALHILQDTLWFDKYNKLEFKPIDIILVEDNPKSNIISIAGNKYSLISYKDFKYSYNQNDFGHISAFNVDYKERIDNEVKLNWLNSYSNNYIRFPNIEMGHGIRINWNSYIDGDVKIGNFVKLNAFTMIGHGASIGDYTYISQFVNLDNSATIGKKCYIFEHSIILPKVCVKDNSIIGAGSVVTKDIPENVIAYGSPAKVVKEND